MSADLKFKRTASLIVSDGEKGIELADLRFTFQIEAAQLEIPNHAEITIYNLNETTSQKILKKGEFNQIRLQVGYEGSSPGQIFSGSITQIRHGKENSKDKFLTIRAVDGDVLYSSTLINKTVPRGTNADEELLLMVDAVPNVKLGYKPSLEGLNPNQALLRDKVMFGMYRQVARQVSKKQNLQWSVNGGKLDFIPLDGYKPGDAVKLNSLTGLIGIPEQTDAGIRLTCLIDPRIQVGGLLEINNREVTQTQVQDVTLTFLAKQEVLFAATQADGLYMVFSIDYSGDSRGDDWYMQIICLAVNRDTQKVVPKL